MEFDDFLTQPKWQILELIAKKPSSPVKISEEIGTSVAYVSQQLKFLEAAGIIKKERTREVGKGKPRLIYSISEDIFHITALINKTPEKKKIIPSIHQKIVLRIWMLDDKDLIYFSEKLLWRVEPFLEDITQISIDTKKSKVTISSKNKKIESIIQSFLKEINNKISCEISPATKDPNLFHQIYNSEAITV